jgi:hypothetical protein
VGSNSFASGLVFYISAGSVTSGVGTNTRAFGVAILMPTKCILFPFNQRERFVLSTKYEKKSLGLFHMHLTNKKSTRNSILLVLIEFAENAGS